VDHGRARETRSGRCAPWGPRLLPVAVAGFLFVAVAVAAGPAAHSGAAGGFAYSVWSSVPDPSVHPNTTSFSDSTSGELGVKFRSDVAGTVSGVRFYKGAGNTGTHSGHLWSSTGTLLASVTFGAETASGWQEADFASPVAIAANTTYVVSYFAPSGHYAADLGYFDPPGSSLADPPMLDNPPLHALASGVDGPNGVYAYSASPTFPNQSGVDTNYWVDVVFSATLPAPAVTATSPTADATNVGLSSTVNVSFSQQMQTGTMQFWVVDGANNPVSGSLSWDSRTRTAIFDPYADLSPSTTYTAKVSGADLAGTPMASQASWSFTTTSTAEPPPSVQGQWAPRISWPGVAIGSEVLNNGKVMTWDESYPDTSTPIFDPDTQTFTSGTVAGIGFMCGAQVHLADGRIMLIGGNPGNFDSGITSAAIYNPATNTWTSADDMHLPRFYPAAVRLADGRVLVISGNTTDDQSWADTPEVYDPANDTWTLLPGIDTSQIHEALYPSAYLMPDGRVFVWAGSTGKSFYIDVNAQTITPGPTSPVYNGVAVQYAPGKILVTGGTAVSGYTAGYGDPSVNSAAVIDLNNASPTWHSVASMHDARSQETLVTLADGRVMAVGGAITFSTSEQTGILPGEIWDPTTEQWSVVTGPMQDPRMNHSSAVLLPDGRVLAAGGGHDPGQVDYYTGEIYSPPYMYQGARPTITNAPASASLGSSITVQTPDAATIAKVSLNELGAITHQYNDDAVYDELAFTTSSGSVNVTVPSNANVISPGDYYLTIVNTAGVPSVSKILHITASGPPANQTIAFNALANHTYGDAAFAVNATATSGLAVTFSTSTTAVCTATGTNGTTITVVGTGSCTVKANQAGNADYNAAPTVQQSFIVNNANQTITFSALANHTYGDAAFAVNATATSGLTVVFSSTTPAVCTATGTNGTTITIVGTGSCTVKANQAGNADYNAAPAVQQTFTVNQASQTITFDALADEAFGQPPITVGATASSGLTVVFSSTTPAVCAVAGTSVTLVATGTCTLEADQAGNANYNAAAPVQRSFRVLTTNQAITFNALTGRVFGDAAFMVHATATSGLAVTFSTTTSAVCTATGTNGATITIVGAGTCTVKADQAGNGTYNPALPVLQSFTIAKANQTITFNALPNHTFGDPAFGVGATATSDLAVTFVTTTPGVCTVSAATVTAVAAGTCTVEARQSGSADYNAAATVQQSFTVAKADQVITFEPLPPETIGKKRSFTLHAAASSGLVVAFAATTPATCTVESTTVTLVKAGACVIRADQRGDGNWNAAASVSRQFTISSAVVVVSRSGYWMLGADGHVYPFDDATNHGNASASAVALAPRRDGTGYWIVDRAGAVFAFGHAAYRGGHPALAPGEFVTTISATPSGNGYWLFTNRGRAINYGDAQWFGDLRGTHLNGPIIASVATPTGRGYYMVGSDGGVFGCGDARFRGSMADHRLNRPIVGLAPTPDNRGYWLVGSDGGVFPFGTARFRGSMGNAHLSRPINGLVAFGNGYLMVAADGGVFVFSDRRFGGSLAGTPLAAPIVGIAAFAT
jgi:hypothetical protein